MEMTQEQRLERLNALAAKERTGMLTAEDAAEQKRLREEYRLAFRAAFRGVLEHTYIRQPDGRLDKLKRRTAPANEQKQEERPTDGKDSDY